MFVDVEMAEAAAVIGANLHIDAFPNPKHSDVAIDVHRRIRGQRFIDIDHPAVPGEDDCHEEKYQQHEGQDEGPARSAYPTRYAHSFLIIAISLRGVYQVTGRVAK